MLTYVAAFVVAMIVAGLLTPVVTAVAHRFGLLDVPNEGRKMHTRAVPRLGGIAVVTAFFAPIIGLAIYTNRISGLLYGDASLVSAMFGGALAIAALGMYDDLRGASPRLKLTVQILVAVVMWVAGFRIELMGNPVGETLVLGSLSLPLTVLWIVGVVNALNLIDGLDGLAAGIALFASIVLFGVAFVDHKILLCLLTATLGGALLGFLFFNFNPAKIFLGDSGSMFLGFTLSIVSIWTQRKGATAVALVIPVIALGVPLLDTTLSFVRRVAKGQSPFQADREHMHHRLIALGLSHRHAVMTLYVVSGVFALGALALLDNDTTRRAIALSTVITVVILLVRRIGVHRALHVSTPNLELRDQVRAAARAMRSAPTLEHAWGLVTEVLPRLECEEIRLAIDLKGPAFGPGHAKRCVYHWRRAGVAEGDAWKLDGVTPEIATMRLLLAEADERFGELAVLLTESGAASPGKTARELLFEVLREALIDLSVDLRAEGDRPRLLVSPEEEQPAPPPMMTAPVTSQPSQPRIRTR